MGLKGPADLQRENPAWIVFPDDVEQTLAADLPEPSVQNFLQDRVGALRRPALADIAVKLCVTRDERS